MRMFRRFALLLLAAALGACDDDSTGPGAADRYFAARSFETLGQTRMSTGDASGAMASRVAAVALRSGLRPARVRIAVDGVTEEYWALEVEHALAGDLTNDLSDAPILELPLVARTMVAWRGGPAERVIAITISSDTGTFTWERFTTSEVTLPYPLYFGPALGIMFDRGGPGHFSVDGGARSTRQTIGAECRVPERPVIAQILATPTPTTCHLATFFTRFSMRVQEGPPAGAAAVRVRTVAMDGHDVPGIRFGFRWFYRPCPVC